MMGVLAGALGLMVAAGVAEGITLRRSLDAIPVRVLVGGIRGKSTLVRLIHAGLISEGVEAWARLTGDAPRVIDPDGRESSCLRLGPANIRELRDVAVSLREQQVGAWVVENMAVAPELQRVVRARLVRPTLQVLAADAPDHLDVLPTDAVERARVVLGALDPAVPMVIQNVPANESLIAQARARFHTVIVPPATNSIEDLYSHEAALLATAQAALDHLGVGVAAREQIRHYLPGGPRVFALGEGRRVVDLLSANDVRSTSALIEEWCRRNSVEPAATHLVFNHRTDRPERLASFRPLLARHATTIIGSRPSWPLLRGLRADWMPTFVESRLPAGAITFLVGNAGGIGPDVRDLLVLRHHALLRERSSAPC